MITINLLWKIFILFLKQLYDNQLEDVKDEEENCKLNQKIYGIWLQCLKLGSC